jgi:hypothetical protein
LQVGCISGRLLAAGHANDDLVTDNAFGQNRRHSVTIGIETRGLAVSVPLDSVSRITFTASLPAAWSQIPFFRLRIDAWIAPKPLRKQIAQRRRRSRGERAAR